MTEKRFINDIDNGKLIDTKGELFTIDYSDAVDFYELWEFLNKLNDENEQLKSRVEYLERKIQRERNATNIQHEKWEKEALEKITNLKRENAKLNIEVEALKQIKPLQKLPQKLTVLKLEDGDDAMIIKDCFHCAYAQSNEDGINCYRETRKRVKGTDTCEYYKKIGDVND